MHKHDPGTYIVYVFSKIGRPKGSSLRSNYTESIKLVDRWSRMTGGTGSVHRCLYNNHLARPCYPEDKQ